MIPHLVTKYIKISEFVQSFLQINQDFLDNHETGEYHWLLVYQSRTRFVFILVNTKQCMQYWKASFYSWLNKIYNGNK